MKTLVSYRFQFLGIRGSLKLLLAIAQAVIISKQITLAAGLAYARANRRELVATAAVAAAAAAALAAA
jgi:TPP-dependent pyruvate/acetoin dehydrogenase alpha subunit